MTSPIARIEALQELAAMQKQVMRLNARVMVARMAVENCYRAAPSKTRSELVAVYVERWNASIATLREAYDASVAFSEAHGITVLPIPSGLQQ